MLWMQSIAELVHFVFSGNQNQSHPGANTAATAGAEDEAGGQTGSGAKSAVGAEKEGALIHVNIQNNTHTQI